MKVYYAHCMTIYNTQEQRDVLMLQRLGFEVVNPNGKVWGMDHFLDIVENEVDAVAFRALPDGSIPAGVAQEVERARACDKPVFELPTGVLRRTLTVEQTREVLKESGQR